MKVLADIEYGNPVVRYLNWDIKDDDYYNSLYYISKVLIPSFGETDDVFKSRVTCKFIEDPDSGSSDIILKVIKMYEPHKVSYYDDYMPNVYHRLKSISVPKKIVNSRYKSYFSLINNKETEGNNESICN